MFKSPEPPKKTDQLIESPMTQSDDGNEFLDRLKTPKGIDEASLNEIEPFTKKGKVMKYVLVCSSIILVVSLFCAFGFGLKNNYILAFNFDRDYEHLYKENSPFLTNIIAILIILTCLIGKRLLLI